MADTGGEVTGLLAELRYARKDSLGRVIPSAYRELRRIPDERADQPLGPADRSPGWRTRASMYRPAVDREWRRLTAKPGVPAALPELAEDKVRGLGELYTRQTRAVDQPLGPADRSPAWQTRASMYRPAVDRERRRLTAKPGVAAALPELADGKVLALGQLNTRQTRLVELRCFEWPWVRETAEVWDIAIRTVKPAGTPAAEWMGAGRRP